MYFTFRFFNFFVLIITVSVFIMQFAATADSLYYNKLSSTSSESFITKGNSIDTYLPECNTFTLILLGIAILFVFTIFRNRTIKR